MKTPAVVGQPVNKAQWNLSGFGRILYVNHKAKAASMIIPRNWWVCKQDPAPGVRAKGPVTLTVHKHGEKCPLSQ